MLTAKSTVAPFTPDTHEHLLHPRVKMADKLVPLEKKQKMLGVTLDTQLTFIQHCNNIAANMQKRNNVLKALAGSTWGWDKETLLTTNRQLAAQYSSTAAPSGRHQSMTLTGAGSITGAKLGVENCRWLSKNG